MTYVWLFVVASALALALTPLVRWLACRAGMLDEPAARKIHTTSVPRVGGIAVVAAMLRQLAWLGIQTETIAVRFRALGAPA